MYADLLALNRMAEVCRDQRMLEAERERLIRVCRGRQGSRGRRRQFRALQERISALGKVVGLKEGSVSKVPEQATPTAGMVHT